jgi:uncharacterized protein (TIGR04222 family)
MTWNPFDWTAGPFLTLYLIAGFIIFFASFRLKSAIGPSAQTVHQLSVLELAYLAGSANRVGDAVLLGLTLGNGATINPKGHKITVTDQTPLADLMDHPPPLQRVKPDINRQQFQSAVKPFVERIQRRLQDLGYYPTDEQMWSFRQSVLPVVALLFVFGLIKVFVGSERHHPVGILSFLLVITVFAGFVLAKRPARTRAGEDALRTYQADKGRAARAPLDHELLFAVALSGAVVLSGTAYASVYDAARTMDSSGGDGGGSGCGGGGGGCGGCS